VELILEVGDEVSRTSMCAARDKMLVTPLLCGGLGGNVEVIKKLLPYSDVRAVDKDQRSLFLCSAIGGKLDCVELAFQQEGTDVNATDSTGRSALIAASRCGASSVVEFLIARGANVNVADSSGVNCLMAACTAHDVACVNVILAAKGGSDLVKAMDKNKHDALFHAVDAFPLGGENTELEAALFAVGAKSSPGALAFVAASKNW
jgi:ankyrin repeat protein